LNSLVQALYMTPEFRSGMYQLSPEELGIVRHRAACLAIVLLIVTTPLPLP